MSLNNVMNAKKDVIGQKKKCRASFKLKTTVIGEQLD